MKTNEIRDGIPQKKTSRNSPTFFPRVIREFDDGTEEPLVYGGRSS